VARYLDLMSPLVPDAEPTVPNPAAVCHSRAWVMVNEEWPKVQADLDGGHLSTLGVIKVKSLDPTQIGLNHQVAAYGYDLDGTNLTLYVYDPNFPNNDRMTLSLSLANPFQPTPVTYASGESVYCFFRTDYSPDTPVAVDAVDALPVRKRRAPRRTRNRTATGPRS
jgi:hypothetical protein